MTNISQHKPLVAVVILNWNGRNFLEKFLPSVLASTYPNLELYVADNGSSDDSIAYLQSIGFENFTVSQSEKKVSNFIIRLAENHGFAQGYNLALQQIKHCDYFVLLNSDVEVSPSWIDPVIELMESDLQIGAAMPKILMYGQDNLFEHAGAAGGWMDKWGYPFCRGRIFGELEKDTGQYNDNAEIFWASGAAMFVRAKLFNDLGGFDADYFAHMEEIDFCWRLKKANYKVMFCSESKVWHVGGGTLPVESPKKVYLNFRNSLTTLLKNKEKATSAIGTVFFRLILDGIAGGMFLTKGKFRHILAILGAHWHFFGQMSRHWKKRKVNKKLIESVAWQGKSNFNASGLYKGSIVFQHFVKKIKTFDKLGIK